MWDLQGEHATKFQMWILPEDRHFLRPLTKGNAPFGAADLYALDTTELPNTDDLYAAEGGLRESMRLYAQAAGAAKTIFLHNGSTAGNHVMLQLYAREGETVLLPRNAHLSAVNACVLGGLRANPDARAMLLVRPDYYGGAMREDVFRRIAAAAHRQGTKVVVDEAHGAHFPWCDGMTSAGALGADAWVQSVHKTLMGLTGSAVLHLADSADERRAWTLLRREQTSSPSFLLMLSIDDSRAWMEENGRARLRALSEAVNDVRRRLVGTPYHDAYADWANLPVRFDPTRLVISAPQGGKCLAEQLREAGLDVEMADERRVVLILSVMDDIAEIRRLPELLASIPAAEGKQFTPLTLMPDMPEAVLTPRQAAMAEEILVPLDRAEGKIAAAAVGLYPPGIPLLAPGERVTREIIRQLQEAGTRERFGVEGEYLRCANV